MHDLKEKSSGLSPNGLAGQRCLVLIRTVRVVSAERGLPDLVQHDNRVLRSFRDGGVATGWRSRFVCGDEGARSRRIVGVGKKCGRRVTYASR